MDDLQNPTILPSSRATEIQAGPEESIQPNMPCPICGLGKLDYNGLLELECPACGVRYGGGAGCT